MKTMNRLLVMFIIVLTAAGCTKKESKESTHRIDNGTRNVVEATSDVMRDVVKGVNDAVYGSKK